MIAADTVVDAGGTALGQACGRRRCGPDAATPLGSRASRAYRLRARAARHRIAGRGTLDGAGALLSPRRSRDRRVRRKAGNRSTRPARYGIQGRAAAIVESIAGDFYTVMGFPLARFVRTMRRLGFSLPTANPVLLQLRPRPRAPRERPIFTYRDERRLLRADRLIIVAALIALVQINAQRTKTESPIAAVATSLFAFAETAVSATAARRARRRRGGRRVAAAGTRQRARCARRTSRCRHENARLHELAAAYAAEAARSRFGRSLSRHRSTRHRIPPENESRTVTIDRGTRAGVRRDDGVVAAGGVVGRIASVGPFTSTVVLVTDYTSRIPAVVRRGRWWGIARGNLGSVRVGIRSAGCAAGSRRRRRHRRGTFVSFGRADRHRDARSSAATQRSIKRRWSSPPSNLGALDRVVVVPR